MGRFFKFVLAWKQIGSYASRVNSNYNITLHARASMVQWILKEFLEDSNPWDFVCSKLHKAFACSRRKSSKDS